jgi:hypothetical protein
MMRTFALPTLAFAGILTAAVAAQQPERKVIPEAEQGEGVSITVYNQNFVVVRERRFLDLPKGRGSIPFRDVAATIVPETVQFTTLTNPGIARIVDQSYLFDLVSADKLLGKFLDRDIAAITVDGESIKGKLLSFDDATLTLQTPGGVEVVPRPGNVQNVQFPTLPEGLLTRPTLDWSVESTKAGRQLCKVAYAAMGMSWQVEYRARLTTSGDKLDLAAWVSVTNGTGTAFKDAQVKLMAGDVMAVSQEISEKRVGHGGGSVAGVQLITSPQVIQIDFAEYHLYELPRRTTLADNSTKQIEMFDISGVPIARRYLSNQGSNRVAVVAEFKNSEASHKGLGIPLPKGTIRIFQAAKDGAGEFVGEASVDHTSKDENVRLWIGNAFDLKAERKTLAVRTAKGKVYEDRQVRLRNHKPEAVTIEAVERVDGDRGAQIITNSHPFERRDVNTVAFTVQVPANAETIITYTVRHDKDQGNTNAKH